MAEILILRLRGIQTLLETAAVEDRVKPRSSNT